MNKAQAAGMELAGETGDIIDRRAGERRAAAPVVAVVAAENINTVGFRALVEEVMHHGMNHVSFDILVSHINNRNRAALASQAQAAVSVPVPTAKDISELWIHEDFAQIETDSTLNLSRKELKNAYVKARDDLAYWKRRALESGVAAQAAVGVASQQEQQPQPSCMPPTRGTGSQPDADSVTGSALYGRLMEMSAIIREGFRWTGNEYAYADKTESDIAMLDDILGDALRLASAFLPALNVPRVRGEGENKVCGASPDLASIASQAQGDKVSSLDITLRQAESLVEFFGGYDCEVTITERLTSWPDQPEGLYAYCTEYPDEGAQYLGPTEVDDDLAKNGRATTPIES